MARETGRLIYLAIDKANAAGLPFGRFTGADTAQELSHWLDKGLDFLSASFGCVECA